MIKDAANWRRSNTDTSNQCTSISEVSISERICLSRQVLTVATNSLFNINIRPLHTHTGGQLTTNVATMVRHDHTATDLGPLLRASVCSTLGLGSHLSTRSWPNGDSIHKEVARHYWAHTGSETSSDNQLSADLAHEMIRARVDSVILNGNVLADAAQQQSTLGLKSKSFVTLDPIYDEDTSPPPSKHSTHSNSKLPASAPHKSSSSTGPVPTLAPTPAEYPASVKREK